MVKPALMLPAGTVTFCGVTTWPSMLPLSRTTAPPAGAGPVSVTVPVVLLSPRMTLLASERSARLGAGAGLPAGITATEAPGARYPSNAVPQLRVPQAGTDPGAVGMLNVAPNAPAAIETFGGVARRDVSLLTSVTSTPPGGAGFNNVNVPVNTSPPTTLSA